MFCTETQVQFKARLSLTILCIIINLSVETGNLHMNDVTKELIARFFN